MLGLSTPSELQHITGGISNFANAEDLAGTVLMCSFFFLLISSGESQAVSQLG